MSCLANENQADFIHYKSSLTIEKALKGTTLCEIERKSPKEIYSIVYFLLSEANESFSMNNKMNDKQIQDTSLELINLFKHDTIEDIIMMLKMAVNGKIGGSKLYRFDANVLFNLFVPEYMELKAVAREDINERKRFEQGSDSTLTIQDVERSYHKERFNNFTQPKKLNKYEIRVKELTKDFNSEDLEALILEWENNEFKQYARYLRAIRTEIKNR